MGLKKAKLRKYWTAADDALIRSLYPKGDVPALAAQLGCTTLSLYQHARAIGVSRDPELVLETCRHLGKRMAELNLGTRFTPGQVSHNKGRKQSEYMSPEAIARTVEKRFKKGHLPHNYKPIGHTRTNKEGYTEIKVRDGDEKNDNFEFLHRKVYEDNFGPIPDGCVVAFKDGNRSNCSPDNLELLTYRENSIRNSVCDKAIVKRWLKVKDNAEVAEYIENYPHLIELKRNELKLNGKLRQLRKKDTGKP